MHQKVRAKHDNAAIEAAWQAEFEAAAKRPLALRWRYSFIHTYKPVLDDAKYRSFDTMEEYRRWCEENLPEWLGYGRVHPPSGCDRSGTTCAAREVDE